MCVKCNFKKKNAHKTFAEGLNKIMSFEHNNITVYNSYNVFAKHASVKYNIIY